jgi:uncharacterized protein YaeQ
MMNHAERIESLNNHITNGTLIRNEWGDGKERACLLAAMSPEVATARDASACPASVMPQWLALITPNMDDRGTLAEWPAFIARYANLANRWHVLDDDAWVRALRESKIAILREARSHTKNRGALTAIDEVIAWIERGEPEEERVEVRRAAAAYADAYAYADAAAAAYAAAAADAAAYAAAAADAAAAYAAAAYATAWDRMNTGILDAIEAQIVAKETP